MQDLCKSCRTFCYFNLFYFGGKWQNSCTILVQKFYFILFYCKWANRLTQFVLCQTEYCTIGPTVCIRYRRMSSAEFVGERFRLSHESEMRTVWMSLQLHDDAGQYCVLQRHSCPIMNPAIRRRIYDRINSYHVSDTPRTRLRVHAELHGSRRHGIARAVEKLRWQISSDPTKTPARQLEGQADEQCQSAGCRSLHRQRLTDNRHVSL